jgi:hypothetical protein
MADDGWRALTDVFPKRTARWAKRLSSRLSTATGPANVSLTVRCGECWRAGLDRGDRTGRDTVRPAPATAAR